MPDWVVCITGQGRQLENGLPSSQTRHFPANSVGMVNRRAGDDAEVWLIGRNETWMVANADIESIDVAKTGDKFARKICNVCHCLKPVGEFAPNQNNLHGAVRRPSCKRCRTDIDKRAPKSSQAKRMEKSRPKKGDNFKCPICQRRSIAGITAKIVADHDHHTGDIRGFICDSCNTGLGRFKNGHDCLKDALAYLDERSPQR